MKDTWYWNYTVAIFDDIENYERVISGITVGRTMADAVATIEEHYGNALVRLEYLESIVDDILEFNVANDYGWEVTAEKNLNF